MSEKKRSFMRWIKPSKLFRRKKLGKEKHTEESAWKPSLPPNQVTVEEECDSQDDLAPETEVPNHSPTLHVSTLPTDDFDLFVKLSNSPTCSVPTNMMEAERKCFPLEADLGRKLHFRPSIDQQTDLSGRNSLVTEDLRRVMSVIERKPSMPKPTSFRRDLARASFRSKSVRERGTAKKVRYPLTLPDSNGVTDENSTIKSSRRLTDLEEPTDASHANLSNLYRVRSFKVTRKGVINLLTAHGDYVEFELVRENGFTGLSKAHPIRVGNKIPDYSRSLTTEHLIVGRSLHSPSFLSTDQFRLPRGSYTPEHQTGEHPDPSRRSTLRGSDGFGMEKVTITATAEPETEQPIRIQIVGFPNVGKTALCRQMITSEFLGARMESMSEDTVERYVTVELDDQTWNIVLIDNFGEAGADELAIVNNIRLQEKGSSATDSPSTQSTLHLLPNSKSTGSTLLKDVMVYLLVFAVDDARSYDYASKVLRLLSKANADQIIMLVANKADLVRCRIVPSEKGKRLAHLHGCKYFEVSTAINHLVDELLVGIILQIKKLRQNRLSPSHLGVPDTTERRMSSLRLHGEAFVRYLREKFDAKSCEDIQWA
ncbi:unnamed protein product [Echinostoma caproni]|uniref:G domain-containing protein n=1 Tax=Echinostoma caproni TaxID=27848 RepID=A0A183A510_9TREM|nr:unnamed protein product [Echinostoma caproni]